MKFYSTLLLLLLCLTSMAQNNARLYGNWIKTKITYKDGRELTDDNTQKYGYLRYSFNKACNVFIAMGYNSKGGEFIYNYSGDILQIKTTAGFLINEFYIEKISDKELVMLQKYNDTFDSPECFRYYFINESVYQQSIPLTAKDIESVVVNDTIYKASEKIYASYKGNIGFHELMLKAVEGLHDAHPLNNHFLATFIVNKAGEADSLHIIEGINPEYDKKYTKTFMKLRKGWIPAIYSSKPVTVKMMDEVKFISREKFPIYERFVDLGDKSMNKGEYAIAVYNFGKALQSYESGDVYYKVAICELVLGDKNAACSAMLKSEKLGNSAATGLMKKYCR